MRFGFSQAADAIEFFEEMNKVSKTSMILLIVAIACGVASIYVNYDPSGHKIENCQGFSSGEDPTIDYCTLNLALPWVAAVLGFVALMMMTTAMGIYDFSFAKSIAGFLESVLMPVTYLKLGGNVIIIAAFAFALAALIVQNQSVGNYMDDNQLIANGQPINEHNVGFILSLVSVICYFLVSGLFNVDAIMSLIKMIDPRSLM